ncbi:MAG: hypothetical protein DRP18_03735 [Candidatus Aenigmatarchaeota archaeon]|nr:MAG: hypothetical protein DRP18_03735 [Candidatus Aenigmarchaeota archaeon]
MARKNYDASLKEELIKKVSEGHSYNQLAKTYNIHPFTISKWCKQAGVESKYKKRYIDDDMLISLIYKLKVASLRDLHRETAIAYSTLINRLDKLADKGMIKKCRLPRVISKNSKGKEVLRGYIGKTIYYLSDKALSEWIIERASRKISTDLKKSINNIFGDIGIKIKFD